MKKGEFMQRLELELYRCGYKERDEVLRDIDDHFASGFWDGRTEEEICKQLGEPEAIARQYAEENGTVPPSQTPPASTASTNSRIAAGIALLLFDFLVGIYLVITAFSVLIALSAAAVAITVSGGAIMIGGLVSFIASVSASGGIFISFAMLFAGAGLLCGGILACIGIYRLIRLGWKGLKTYVLWHGKIFQGV